MSQQSQGSYVFNRVVRPPLSEPGVHMSFQNNVLSFESIRASGSRPELKDEHRAVVSSCRQAVFKLAPKLMNEMFESLDDALYELADKAESNIRQTAFFDAMREIRKTASAWRLVSASRS